jgi:hypothetical protein
LCALRLPPALFLLHHRANVGSFGVHPAKEHSALENVSKLGQLKQALAPAGRSVDDALEPGFAPPCNRKARHLSSPISCYYSADPAYKDSTVFAEINHFATRQAKRTVWGWGEALKRQCRAA